MATLKASLSLFTLYSPSRSSKFVLYQPSPPSTNLRNSAITTSLYTRNPLFSIDTTRKPGFVPFCTAQEVAVESKAEQTQEANRKTKLYLSNLPWSLSGTEMKTLFSECGTVKDVEIIKQEGGRSRGFAFVTMASEDEAQAVVDKFDSRELSGRIVRVEFAKRLKKPSPPRPADPPAGETRHKLYVSNLGWKVRSSHLRELISANHNPLSTRVVFGSPSGKSSGYGFVSFATKEEADDAISALDGTELMGRPLRLTLSEKNIGESGNEKEKEDIVEKQSEE